MPSFGENNGHSAQPGSGDNLTCSPLSAGRYVARVGNPSPIGTCYIPLLSPPLRCLRTKEVRMWFQSRPAGIFVAGVLCSLSLVMGSLAASPVQSDVPFREQLHAS